MGALDQAQGGAIAPGLAAAAAQAGAPGVQPEAAGAGAPPLEMPTPGPAAGLHQAQALHHRPLPPDHKAPLHRAQPVR